MRLKMRKSRLFWRHHFGLKWFSIWALALIIYLVIGLQPVEAKNYRIIDQLSIPSIGLVSDVTELQLENGNLVTPDTLVGSYSNSYNKTLLIGHSTGIFANLHSLKEGDPLEYGEKNYTVVSTEILPKTEINMQKLLKAEENDTLILMTCSGTVFSNGDATDRLIVVAK